MKLPLIIGGVATRPGRIRPHPGPVIVAVCDALNPMLTDCGWLDSAPFDTVSLILRFGDSRADTEVKPVNATHAELPIARDLSIDSCIDCARDGTLFDLFHTETVTALLDVSRAFDLPTDWHGKLST
ncbi:hypothetical protein RBSH_03116 [Rhodopirellula baltica SH28]|uniref:Uncharacterized protein n=1 Tax=Rhodopirellula baltica SH28 TaxID=993517 RepID=K5CD66_RHOBT|nr:Imm39 family immunity protein [Rhodopirellula baltica]EKK01555.1 hypothetical protein RBSH_03116 [Rhodopirellula baltica SH28]